MPGGCLPDPRGGGGVCLVRGGVGWSAWSRGVSAWSRGCLPGPGGGLPGPGEGLSAWLCKVIRVSTHTTRYT